MTADDGGGAPPAAADPCREIVDAIDGLILRLDPDGRVTFVSRGGLGLLGPAADALAGRSLRETVHADDRPALDAAVGRIGPPDEIVIRLRHADGRWRAVAACVRHLPGTRDRVVTVRGTPQDRAPHDRALHDRAPHAHPRMTGDHYRALVDTLPQLVWMERADTGETIYVNQAFTTYCGPVPTHEAARADLFHPADAEAVAGAYAQARADGTSAEIQGRLRNAAGAYRWHRLVFRPLLKGGALIGWLGSALDIDEIVASRQMLLEAGELLRIAQEAAGTGLFDVDVAAGDVILAPESAHLHGLPPDRPAVLRLSDWMRCVAPADRAPTLRAVRAAITEDRTFDVAFRVPVPDGRDRWIQAIGRRVQGRPDAPARLAGLILDITARKDGEAALVAAKADAEAARAEAERANAAKTNFLSAMSHEIRTPLNAMIGFASLLAGSPRLADDLQRYADLARVAGESLRTVVDDILDFASVEAGVVSLRPEPFAVRAVVDDCLGIVGASAAAKGLGATALIDAAVPDTLVGDPGRLRQILLNLLNNAVKFTQAGSVTVRLCHEGRTPWGERVCVSVIDTGIGIPADRQPRLFQRFSQADDTVRSTYGGTGLGLAICRQLVERMGGTIGVTSQAGGGATFWFTLTLPRAAGAPDGPAAAPSTAPPAGRRGRILLVEDIEINRELACVVLRGAGHTVDVAADGIEAVRAVEAGAYDLVLMDVQMPRMDGMVATRLIRCLPGPSAGVPVIAMTANVLPDQLAAFREAGMDDHFGKPFQPHELGAAVERWLRTDAGAAPPAAGHDAGVGTVTIDRERYEENLATLGPRTLEQLLTHFHVRIRDPFPGTGATAEGRDALRREAHALAAAAGLLGFAPLSRACAALERATDDGDFLERVASARGLAAQAAAETLALLAEGAPPAARALGERR
ncbi:ATP-binding protein [Methylobacterium sp. NEAU 140]|uniref:ATP-binding protein n=1 Tax=Methylobacterium sp. NEAU 140 TaxID=3064945 RepID=UPI002736DD8E|nr:ATP-binding protein [Methylobacterium sp. NEAU 140]MDP4023013.1 ATP-binding protein [Methylobacterium sp. NEAU 140]